MLTRDTRVPDQVRAGEAGRVPSVPPHGGRADAGEQANIRGKVVSALRRPRLSPSAGGYASLGLPHETRMGKNGTQQRPTKHFIGRQVLTWRRSSEGEGNASFIQTEFLHDCRAHREYADLSIRAQFDFPKRRIHTGRRPWFRGRSFPESRSRQTADAEHRPSFQ